MCFKENYCVIQQGYFISFFFSYHQGYVDLNGILGVDSEMGFSYRYGELKKIPLRYFSQKNDLMTILLISVRFHEPRANQAPQDSRWERKQHLRKQMSSYSTSREWKTLLATPSSPVLSLTLGNCVTAHRKGIHYQGRGRHSLNF